MNKLSFRVVILVKFVCSAQEVRMDGNTLDYNNRK